MRVNRRRLKNPEYLLMRNQSLTLENKDLKLKNYQLREELMRLEAKLAQAFNQLMVYEEPAERKFR